MCGIAGAIILGAPIKRTDGMVNPSLIICHLLQEIESRGTHASGFLSIIGNSALDMAVPMKATEALKNPDFTKAMKSFTSACLLHTRQSTGGDPGKRRNNHPVKCGSVFVTHNGQIHNDTAIKKTLKEKHWREEEFASGYPEVDTFALAAMIDMYIESGKGLQESVKDALVLCEGYARCAIWSEKFPNHVILLSSDGNSLDVGLTFDRRTILYASDASFIYGALDKTYKRINDTFPLVMCASLKKKILCIDTKTGTIASNDCPSMKEKAWLYTEHYGYWSKALDSEPNNGDIFPEHQNWYEDKGKLVACAASQMRINWDEMRRHITYITSSHKVGKNHIAMAHRLFEGKMKNTPLYAMIGNAMRICSKNIYPCKVGDPMPPMLFYWNLYASGTVECIWNPNEKRYISPLTMKGRAYDVFSTTGELDPSLAIDTVFMKK